MVKFDIATVSADGTKLLIGATVLDLPYYKDVTISKVYIDTQDTFESNRPSSNAWEKSFSGDNKSEYLEIQYEDIDDNGLTFPKPSDNLFFIYIETTTNIEPDTPCGFDNKFSMTYAYDTCSVRERLMPYMKQIARNCDIPKEFINLFLQSKAVEISLCQGHYPEGIKFYNAFIKHPRIVRDSPDTFNNLLEGFTLKDTKNCGCYG